MRILTLVCLAALLAAGCTSAERKALGAKCDASLRARATELAHAGPGDSLDVLGRADGTVDAGRAQKLLAAGARPVRLTGELFVARVATRRLGRVAALDFVRTLALSQEREATTP